jgi:enterochelin esterase-like enzyme
MHWRRKGASVTLAALALLLPVRSGHAAGASPLPAGFAQIEHGPDGGSVWQGRIANTYVPSASRPTVVYLPPGFDPQSRYPVAYLLQGFRGSPYQYVDGLDLAGRADELIAARDVTPFIAVIPPAGLTARFDGEWTGVWEDYLLHDVIPWVNGHLPTEQGAQGRVIAGLSAGAYGAVDIGLRHPHLFGTLESWSGYFTAPHDGSLARATVDELAAHDPSLLVTREAPLLRHLGTRFLLSCGTDDRAAARATETFAGELTLLRLPHRLWLGPGGHDGRFWRSQLAPALRYALPDPAARA